MIQRTPAHQACQIYIQGHTNKSQKSHSEVIIALKSVFCLKNANVLPCSMHKLRVLVVDAMDHNRNKISAEL